LKQTFDAAPKAASPNGHFKQVSRQFALAKTSFSVACCALAFRAMRAGFLKTSNERTPDQERVFQHNQLKHGTSKINANSGETKYDRMTE